MAMKPGPSLWLCQSHSSKNHHVNRAPDVETCHEEKRSANLLSKSQSLPAEVRESERTTLNLPKLTNNDERVSAIIRETIVSASHLCHVCEDRDWKLDDYETTTLANYEHGRRWYLHLMNKDDYKNNYRSINALAIEQPKQATGLCISQVHCH